MTDGAIELCFIEDILHCTRPILFETGYEEFPYGAGGSSFVIRHAGRLFVVTARHCISDNRPENVLIQVSRNSFSMFPISIVSSGESDEYEDPVHSDISILVVDISKVPANELKLIEYFSIKDLTAIPEDELWTGKLYYRGYLKQVFTDRPSGIDIDNKSIHFIPLAGNAVYKGPSSFDHVHELNMPNLPSEIKSLDGLSGSPIFHVTQDKEGRDICRLAGLLVRAHIDKGNGLFLSDKVIYTALYHQLK